MRVLRTPHKHPDGKIFSWMSMVYGLGLGLILPILPDFVGTFMGDNDTMISLFFSAMAIAVFIASLLSTVFFKKFERTTITKTSLVFAGIILLSFTIITKASTLYILESLRGAAYLFFFITLALFVRDFSNRVKLGENEGQFFRFSAIGMLAGPIIGGFVGAYMGYESVFLLATLVIFIGLGYFWHSQEVRKHKSIINRKHISTHGIFKNIKDFFSNINLKKGYIIYVAFMMWVTFKRLYLPLYVALNGYNASLSGMIIGLIILPLILLEVRVGKYADKHGIRMPISVGYLIMGIVLLTVFVSPFPFFNCVIVLLAGIGEAFIEPSKESFVASSMPKKDEDRLYGIQMTADPLAYFITPAIGALILTLLPFKFLFLFFGLFMCAVGYYTFRTLKNL